MVRKPLTVNYSKVLQQFLRRGFQVHIGKVGNAEIDFIAIGEDGEQYYQVAYTVMGVGNLAEPL
jgi:cobalamin biosynthesis protein CobT